MAGQQLTLPGQVVKKDNRLIRTRINIDSVDAGRILANLISCIHADDKAVQDSYSVAAKEFLTDSSGRGYVRLKALCRELAKATAEVEEPDPDPKAEHPIFTVCPFFSKIRYRNGIVTAAFNPVMAPYLLQLKSCFTQYNLIEYLKLPSIYSQRLFEIIKSWSKLPEVIISIDKLHHILNTPPSFRANFKALRVFVLEKAHKDIHEQTSLRYEWEPIKAGRSVESIRFIFGPERKALAAAEQEKVKQEKQRRLNNQRILRAIDCATAKGGDCRTQDQRPIVCKVCRQWNVCADVRKKRG